QALLSEKESILNASEKVVSENKELTEYRIILSNQQKEKDIIYKAVEGLSSKRSDIISEVSDANHDKELSGLSAEIKTLLDKKKDLDRKDPDCKSTTCSFIVGALDAIKRLPMLKKQYDERKTALDSCLKIHLEGLEQIEKELKEKNQDIGSLDARMDETSFLITESESIIKEAEAKARLLPDIKVAYEKLLNLQVRETEITDSGLKIKADFESRKETNSKKLAVVETIISGLRSGMNSSLQETSSKLESEIKE
ncbi:unnamed protein product, partial [marine sediment metagenome]